MRSLLHAVLLSLVLLCGPAVGATFKELPESAVADMSRQREYVARLADEVGRSISQSEQDLEVIQEIISRKLVTRNEIWEVKALGVAFGDALISQEPQFKWMLIREEQSTKRVLVFGDTDLRTFPIELIEQRMWDADEKPFVVSLGRRLLAISREAAKRSAERRKAAQPGATDNPDDAQ